VALERLRKTFKPGGRQNLAQRQTFIDARVLLALGLLIHDDFCMVGDEHPGNVTEHTQITALPMHH
jgi:hypothetical protein